MRRRRGHREPKPSVFVKIQKGQLGTERHPDRYNVLIALKNKKLLSSANGTVYRLCDIVQTLPETLDCNGFQWPVTMVLKLYCRIPESKLKQQREAIRYAKLLNGKPTFSDD